jgi:SAM-dependent methyltransferase
MRWYLKAKNDNLQTSLPRADQPLSRQSNTTTLASTILRHCEENGRTYHKFGRGKNDYWAPNDDQQNAQLDLGHHMLTLLLDNRLYLSPIDEHCHRVIDLGCGTGIWTLGFADMHPSAEVVGVDLSPIQPTWVAPNCRFVIDDCECEWAYPTDYFDFVYIRCLYGSVSDWPALYRQIYKHTKPGGFIEQMEMSVKFTSDDGAADSDDVMAEWSQIFIDAGERIGKSFKIADQAAFLIRDAGFVDVVERWFKVPVGPWPKDKRLREIGRQNYHFCNEGLEGWALYLLTRIMGWKAPEVHILVARMKSALNERRNQGYYSM